MTDPCATPLSYIQNYLASAHDLPLADLDGARTFESLDLDSIAQVEMFVTLSDHYRIHLDDSLATAEMTLAQTAKVVEEALRETPAVPRQDSAADPRATAARA
ncbi:acyl carrier protein [Streptomyces sp. NPDC029721]|uniref:acyl carrier protein n=1 Tax=Streptomyces sp. NPDC029721 TaxID=3157090 RepID=UPI0033D7118F